MFNIKLLIEYNGSGFHGWQIQPGLRTIQGEIQRVLEMVLRETPKGLIAAGRTDAGVHAKAQVANFYVENEPNLTRLVHSLSSILKSEVSVLSAEIVPEDFCALKNIERKQYTYTILNRPAPAVLDRGYVWHISSELDFEKMSDEAVALVGVHDFSSFRGHACTAKTPIKEIFESEVIRDGDYIIYRVIGKGFLKQMIRNIVGTLVGLAKGNLKATSIPEILEAKDRKVAGVTAPPYGLCMDWVKYR